MKKSLLLFTLFLFSFATPSYARSYSIDEVHIRAWVQTNGNVLVNEVFHYTFSGTYDHVIRSVHTEGHDGVQKFEAYELLDSSAEPGFITERELQPLPVTQKENRYSAELASKDERKAIFFTYELLNSVQTYDTYSDVAIPFFGTDENHDKTLENVTIDVVFPEAIKPSQYYAFMHDRLGSVSEKGAEVVRFTTPKSPLYSLTEVRVLFPSSVMASSQPTTKAPVTMMEAVEQENQLAQSFYQKEEQKQKLETILKVLSGALSLGILVVLLLRFRGGSGDSNSVLHQNPLTLYMIDRNGSPDEYALLAGLYSLVEKGMADAQVVPSKGRFQKDPDAPNQTLRFTLKGNHKHAVTCDQQLIKMLFKNRNTFTLHDIAGLTKLEKKEKKGVNLSSKVRHYQDQQNEWTDCVVKEMKKEGFFSNSIPSCLKISMLLSVYSFILYAYTIDSLGASASMLYGVIGFLLLLLIWRKPKKRWPAILFYMISLTAVAMLYDTDSAIWLLSFILTSALLYTLTPRFLLSNEAAVTKADIYAFKKMAKRTDNLSDKWMVRSILLRTKRADAKGTVDSSLAAAAPFTYLLLTEQEPIQYMTQTWKWSTPPGSSSSDGGGGYFGDSAGGDSGGGSDGGGGGAD